MHTTINVSSLHISSVPLQVLETNALSYCHLNGCHNTLTCSGLMNTSR